VLVVAEQFRSDYLNLHGADFGEGGFRRLIEGGSLVRRSRFDYLTTLSAPGAATLATGAWPSGHGIVANSWYDAESGQIVDAVGGASNPSPSALVGSTVADQLVLASAGRSKVVSISGSAAPGVMLAGRRPAGCYWRDEYGQFRTSAFYSSSLPEWVRKFNDEHPIVSGGPRAWVALGADPSAPPLRILKGSAFLNLYKASHFAVDGAFEFAKAAVINERLGARDYPDLLIINLSAPALLALETGAHSPLMRDLIVRMDGSLAGFLDWLDSTVGDNVAVVFTGAHGTPPQAADLNGAGLRMGRVSGEGIVGRVTAALDAAPSPRFFVEKYVYPFLYLGVSTRLATESDRDRAGQIAARAAQSVEGVHRAFVEALRDPRVRRSSYPGRSGDVALAYEPFTVEAYGENRGVASGSYHRYDTDVPLILFGRQFRKVTIQRDVPATVVAPTLATILDIASPSGATESPLAEALMPYGSAVVGPPEPGATVE